MIDRACISLGERCNLKCGYCHFKKNLTEKPQEFSIQELIELIENINRNSEKNKIEIFKIGIVGSGEPFLEFQKIEKIVQYVKEKKYNRLRFYTVTNGTIMSDDILNFIYENKDIISICFSLDGYEELHNVGREKFIDTYNNIERYEKIFGKKPAINCTVHIETLKNIEKLKSFFIVNKFNEINFSKMVGNFKDLDEISNQEYTEFIEKFNTKQFLIRQLRSENINKYDCTMYGKLCGVGKTNIFITKQGIFPCGRFYGKEEFNYGCFSERFDKIEEKMSKMLKIKAGECYYKKYVLEEK